MKCEEIRNKLPAYLLDDLPDAEREQVKAHLQSCSSCRKETAGLKSVLATLGKWEDILPQNRLVFVPGERQTVVRWPSGRWAVGFRWAWRAAVAAAVLALFLTRVEIRMGNGGLFIGIGQTEKRKAPAAAVPANWVQYLEAQRQQDLYLFNQMLAASEERQREWMEANLNQLIRQIQQQRLEDLRFLGENFLKIQQTSVQHLDRTNAILEGLVKVAATRTMMPEQ